MWFNIGVHGVPQQASACQPYDALVSTPEGLVPIGELVEDDAVGTKVLRRVRDHVSRRGEGATARSKCCVCTRRPESRSTSLPTTSCGEASGQDGRFVPAGELAPGDQLEWHRAEVVGRRARSTSLEIAEAALAGWLQSDGFVGQYEGTNRSLTIEAMTVTDAE